jgi:AraC-like DNA-binding protein
MPRESLTFTAIDRTAEDQVGQDRSGQDRSGQDRAEAGDGIWVRKAAGDFDAYQAIYAVGADTDRVDGRFHAHIRVRRYPRVILYDRRLSGVAHRRSPGRVRRDGFDHITLHLLRAGDLVGGHLDGQHRLRPGEIMVIDTSRPHWTRIERAHLISVQLPRDVVRERLPVLDHIHGAVLSDGAGGLLSDFIGALMRRIDALPEAATDGTATLIAELLGLSFAGVAATPMAQLVSQNGAGSLRRARAEAFIATHLGDPRLDTEAIAAGIGTSRSILYQSFAEDGGVGRYITQRRLDHLRRALRHPGDERSVASLAQAYGFSSQSHCSRSFRAAFGRPPSQYRAETRQDRMMGRMMGQTDDGLDAVIARWTAEL